MTTSRRIPVTDAALPSPVKGWSVHALMIFLALALIVPLLLALIHNLNDDRQRIRHSAESLALNLAQVAAHTLERQLADTRQLLSAMALRADMRALNARRCGEIFGDFGTAHPGFSALTTTTLDGTLICSSLPSHFAHLPLPAVLTSAEHTADLPCLIGNAQPGPITGKWVVPVSHALLDEAGQLNGLLTAWIDLVRLTPLNETTLKRLPPGALTMIFDDRNVIVGRSHAAENWVGRPTGFPASAFAERQGFFTFTPDADRIERLFAVAPIQGSSWLVASGIPTMVIDEQTAHARREWFAVLAGILLFVGCVAWLVRRYAVRPIQHVAEIADAVKKGDLRRRVRVDQVGTVAEIDRVARQFNAMLDTLAADTERLETAERLLQQSNESLSITLASIGDAVIATDVDGCVTRMNPTAERLTGWSLADACGRLLPDVFRIVNAKTRQSVANPVRRVIDLGRVVGLANDTVLLARDGSEYQIADSAAPIRNDSGEIVGVVLVFSDVTEQYRTEQALRDSEERYRTAFNTSPDALAISRLHDGVYVDVNEGFVETFGWPRDEIIGRSSLELAIWPNHEARQTMVDALERDASCKNLEVEVMRRNGRTLSALLSANIIAIKGELFLLSVVHDISERKASEQALLESESRFRTIFEKNSSVMLLVEPESGTIVDANVTAVAYYGYPRARLLTMSISDINVLPADEVAEARRRAARGELKTVIFPHRLASGEVRDVEVHLTPVESGGRALLFSIVNDVTAKALAEKALLSSELFARATIDAVAENLCVLERSGTLLAVNKAWRDFYAHNDPEAALRDFGIGSNYLTLCDSASGPGSDIAAAMGEGIRAVIDGRQDIFTVEYPCHGPHEQRWFAARVTRFHGDSGNVVVAHENITERKHAQAELERYHQHLEELVASRTAEIEQSRKAAEAANLAKSAFLANMSHEIRTPMNAILGMANVLRRSQLTPAQGERLDRIDAAGKHLLGTISDILDLSRIEAGKLVLADEAVAIDGLMRNVSALVSERAGAKSLALHVEVAPLPAALFGDPTRLQQALLNYATNAVKFTEKGHVILRARAEQETDAHLRVRFEVEDSGIGIAAQTVPRLFGAFEQADNSTTRKYSGSGLGLAITRRLAELMDGAVGVESTPGVGSTFWFTACLRKGETYAMAHEQATPEAEQHLRERHAGRRILLVDDEPVNLAVAQFLLEDAGLAVDTAEDGAQAVARSRETSYAAILMDMQMPILNGLEATAAIRAGGSEIPIVAMTANAFSEDRSRCLAAGMNDFLAKPFNPELLFSTVLKWLDARYK